MNELLTVTEVAHRFRVNPVTVYRWERDGTLEGIRVGGVVRFRAADIDAILNPLPDPEPAA